MAKGNRKSRDQAQAAIPRSEREAVLYELQLNKFIRSRRGQYLRAEDGTLHLVLGSLRVSLAFDRDNHNLARLMLEACGVSSLSPGAQAAIQRLQVTAQKEATNLVIR